MKILMFRSVQISLLIISIFFVDIRVADAQSMTWTVAINNVQKMLDKYSEAHRARAGYIGIGTALNNADLRMHRCAIAGRMLGLKDRVGIFEPPYPPIESADLDELAWSVASLDNWISIANSIRHLPVSAKAKLWNLECAVEPGLRDTFLPIEGTGSENEFYELSDDSETLIVLGKIEVGFFDRLEGALSENPNVKFIALGSPGGAIYEAMRAGLLIRERKIETTQYADCFSACPLVFLGGVRRTIWDGTDKMGFHQVSQNGKAVPLSSEVYDHVRSYVSKMGADPAIVLAWMHYSGPNEMTIRQWDDLCMAGIATFVYHSCLVQK